MSTLLVNNIEPFSGNSLNISGSLGTGIKVDGGMNTLNLNGIVSASQHLNVAQTTTLANTLVTNLTASGRVSLESVVLIGTGSQVAVSTSNVNFNSLPGADPGVQGRLFTQSGSQLFSSSAFPGGSNPVFTSGQFSSSIFVFVSD